MGYQPIESYGVIGDLHTVALVGIDGAIDFLCFPRFDSPSVFAALLDHERGGSFSICPALPEARAKQLYLPDTNILLTRFLSEQGVAEIQDLMPVAEAGHNHTVVRRVKTVRGEVCFRLRCAPRFDYARAGHEVRREGDGVVFTSKGSDGTTLRLRSRVPLELEGGDATANFTLCTGEKADFILEDVEAADAWPPLDEDGVTRIVEETAHYWRRWLGQITYRGRWRDMVNRSALVLKLLFSNEFGSLVAAPTFGLPELVGGERNWDYRYTWIRDAAFTLYALTRLGFRSEAGGFMSWIERERAALARGSGTGPLQVMYGIDGRERLDEEILHHLEGYRGSRPVRVGNAAYDQLQLDIYGELLDAIYLFNRHGAPIAYDLWRDLTGIVDWVADNWEQADEGMWEVRGGKKEFLHSRLMCWVALDRALRIASDRSFPAPLERWLHARDAIYRDIYDNFWNPDPGYFVQHKGGTAIDASSLLMPMVRFISFREPRWLSHLAVVDRELVEDSLVHRYRIGDAAPDGLPGTEGTFSMCSFWWVENLARAGHVDRARFAFDKMLGYANHLGLYAEELGSMGEHLGNFPQAFTHLGLISAAVALDAALEEAGWRA